jgi:hypothetical protein
MSETMLKDGLPMAQALFGMHKLPAQVSKILAAEILEFAAFEQIPYTFLWVEFRCIARQALQMDPFAHRTGKKLLDHIRTMDGRSMCAVSAFMKSP